MDKFSLVKKMIKGIGPGLEEAMAGSKLARAVPKVASKMPEIMDDEKILLHSFDDYLKRNPEKAKTMDAWTKQMREINPAYEPHLDRSYIIESKTHDPEKLMLMADKIRKLKGMD